VIVMNWAGLLNKQVIGADSWVDVERRGGSDSCAVGAAW
jgi:hypothetical protein